jgi:hypothetical protein
MPIRSVSTCSVYPHKHLSADKPGVSSVPDDPFYVVRYLFCSFFLLFIRNDLRVDFFQRRRVDESQHMAADRCSRVHLLRADPQHTNRRCLRPCSSGR